MMNAALKIQGIELSNNSSSTIKEIRQICQIGMTYNTITLVLAEIGPRIQEEILCNHECYQMLQSMSKCRNVDVLKIIEIAAIVQSELLQTAEITNYKKNMMNLSKQFHIIKILRQ